MWKDSLLIGLRTADDTPALHDGAREVRPAAVLIADRPLLAERINQLRAMSQPIGDAPFGVVRLAATHEGDEGDEDHDELVMGLVAMRSWGVEVLPLGASRPVSYPAHVLVSVRTGLTALDLQRLHAHRYHALSEENLSRWLCGLDRLRGDEREPRIGMQVELRDQSRRWEVFEVHDASVHLRSMADASVTHLLPRDQWSAETLYALHAHGPRQARVGMRVRAQLWPHDEHAGADTVFVQGRIIGLQQVLYYRAVPALGQRAVTTQEVDCYLLDNGQRIPRHAEHLLPDPDEDGWSMTITELPAAGQPLPVLDDVALPEEAPLSPWTLPWVRAIFGGHPIEASEEPPRDEDAPDALEGEEDPDDTVETETIAAPVPNAPVEADAAPAALAPLA